MLNKQKIYEIYTFTRQGGLSFITNKKCLAHEIWTLESNFELMVGNFVLFCISVQNFRKFGQV